MDNKTIGVLIAVGCIFIANEFLLPYIKSKLEILKAHKKIRQTMEKENLDFNRAAELFFSEDLGLSFGISLKEWEIGGLKAKQGDRIGFQTDDGMVVGIFLGLRESKAAGYSYHFILSSKKENKTEIVSMPVEEVYEDTFNIYRS